MKKIAELIWSILISLRLAVIIIASLTISLIVATLVEAEYNTKTAQYFIYQAAWFYALLSALGLNILAVAISRYPWKKKHIPFLLAHVGILMLLAGSWSSYIKGVDGNVRITEGETSSSIELDQHVLSLTDGENLKSYPLSWRPPVIAKSFKPMPLEEFGLVVDRYLSDAETKISFPPASDAATASKSKTGAAVQFKIIGAPMGGAPEVWLWSGDSGWAMQKMGLARFLVRREDQKDYPINPGEARFDFVVMKDGKLRYEAVSIRGEKTSGVINTASKELQIIDPGWRMPIKIQFKKFVLNAINQTDYLPATNKISGSGENPTPAIHLRVMGTESEDNSSNSMWLGLGDRAELVKPDGTKITVGFFPKIIVLPFGLHLKKFEVQHDPGTTNPAAYISYVQPVEKLQKNQTEMDGLPVHTISMNEPLVTHNYTFYQASFIPDFPRPTTTILSVNYDPGRELKYWGSLLIVLGSILLFAIKSYTKKKEAKVAV